MPAKPRARNIPTRPAPRRRELSYLIAAILASGTATEYAAAREVPFTAAPPIASGVNQTRGLYPADIDGDGDMDMLAAHSDAKRVYWHENTLGDASAWSIHTISTEFTVAESVYAADLDGDGDLDALSAPGNNDTISWYKNNGTSGPWARGTISLAQDDPNWVRTADLDGDGDLDVVVGSPQDDTVAWYENDGDGGGWAPHTVNPAADMTSKFVLADIDGDGDMDVAMGSGYSEIAWFENDGSGGTWAKQTVTTAIFTPTSVASADVDNDGDVDVMAFVSSGSTAIWLENAGQGQTWTLHTIATGLDSQTSLFAADVDGDGDVDAITTGAHYQGLRWHENEGDGIAWTSRTLIPSEYLYAARAVTAADLDGDGDVDLATSVYSDHEIRWYRNDTIHRSAAFLPGSQISTLPSGPRAVHAADIDRDGDQDALVASFNSNSIAWFENDGTGSTWTSTNIATAIFDAEAVHAADLDGDGDPDVLAASFSNNAVTWHENGPGGTWTAHTVSGSVPGALDVVAADLDRDGDLDVIAVSLLQAFVAWYENDGTGGTWSPEHIATSLIGVNTVMTSDVDADGDLDVLTSASSSGLIAWHENDGTGSPWPLHTISSLPDSPSSVFAGDVDGDGDVDVLSTSSYDGLIAWHENDGTALGWTLRTVSTAAASPTSGRLADLDSDGDLDIYVADSAGDALVWFENTAGDGSTWAAHTVTTSADGSSSVVAADFDNDGDLELLGASFNDDGLRLYRNGGGQFAVPTLNTAQKFVNNASTHDLLDIQAIHRGRMGDSDAELVTLELKLTDGAGVDLTSAEANSLIEELRVYLDDGSGVFEAGSDTVARTVSSFSLAAGVQTVIFGEGDPNAQLPFGSPKVYFVVADLTADADSQTPSAFQVGHLTESSSSGEDAPNDIPLTLEFWPNTGTGVVHTVLSTASCEAPFDLQLADRTVDFALVCEAGTILSAETFSLTGSADVTFRSGEQVTLLPGFSVQGGQFSVQIDPALQP